MTDERQNPADDQGAEIRPLEKNSGKTITRETPGVAFLGLFALILLVAIFRAQARAIANMLTAIAALWLGFKLLAWKLSQSEDIMGSLKKRIETSGISGLNRITLLGAIGILAVWGLVAALIWWLPLWLAETLHIQFFYQDDAAWALMWGLGCGPALAGIVFLVGTVKTLRAFIQRQKR